jgi:hypothetical protein
VAGTNKADAVDAAVDATTAAVDATTAVVDATTAAFDATTAAVDEEGCSVESPIWSEDDLASLDLSQLPRCAFLIRKICKMFVHIHVEVFISSRSKSCTYKKKYLRFTNMKLVLKDVLIKSCTSGESNAICNLVLHQKDYTGQILRPYKVIERTKHNLSLTP